MGRPDFRPPVAHLAPLVTHALHDDNADVVGRVSTMDYRLRLQLIQS